MKKSRFFLSVFTIFLFVSITGSSQKNYFVDFNKMSLFPPDTDGDGIDDDLDEDDDNDGILDVDETVSCETFGEIFFDPTPSDGNQEATFTFGDGSQGLFTFELDDPNYVVNGYPKYLWGTDYIRASRGNGLSGVTKVVFPNGMRNFKIAVANLHSNSTDEAGTNGTLYETQSIAFYHDGTTIEITPSKITNGGLYNQGNLYPGSADAIDQAIFVFEIYQEIDSIVNTSIGTLDHTSLRVNGICISDSDGDGIINALDTDSDNDGIPDEEEGLSDCNNDGNPNFTDPNPCFDLENVFIPQGFSPNNDGVNDTFEITGFENFPNNRLIIFNRWGNKIFEASPYLNDWAGTNQFSGFNGQLLPDGTYFYIFSANQDEIPDIKGWLYLKRKVEFVRE